MKFQKESGAILSPNKQILYWVEGSAGQVDIPQQLAWKLHKIKPGTVWAFAHVHPPGMISLSHEDETTLQAWTIAFHPWPFRFITITETPNGMFIETTYLGQLESLEEWQMRPRKAKESRRFTITTEKQRTVNFLRAGYLNILWRKSYK